jgi:RHS repeat-associated protein
MAVLSALRGVAAKAGAWRRDPVRRSGHPLRFRSAISALMGPVIAAGTSLVPLAVTGVVTAGVAAAVVAKAAPAKAQTSAPVLVLLQNGETTAPETTVLDNAGYSVTQITSATWASEPTSYFESFAALVIGDPSSGGSCSSLTPVTGTAGSGQVSIGANWQAAVTGNIAVLGTAPALPGTSGADSLISDSVGYAAAGYDSSASTGTGLYVSLNCEYSTVASGTTVALLNGVEGIGTVGGITVNGNLSCTDAGTVNTWEADAAATFGGFTSSDLATGANAFPAPACPVQEAFDSWPAIFTPVAYDASSNSDVTANFTASDGVTGQPYVLIGAPAASSDTQALAPSIGGEVLAGTTSGGNSNPAAPGISQATAADPVDPEDGDFTQSDTDVSIPTFGPSLDFTRTYDSDLAEQQTQAGTPGSMGYGWTDNWASSLATNQAVPGDLYTIDGLATNTGLNGPATQAAVSNPAGVYVDGNGNVYIADSQGNRILEVAAANQTQWGISMTKGDVYVIAGSPAGKAGSSGNGTLAADSLLNDPVSVAMDNSGDLFIADYGNDRVMELTASTSPWGNMSGPAADAVYRVAGIGGNHGDGADGEAATSSDLNDPTGVFIGGNAGGNLYIADSGNNRIQMVSQINQTKWGQSMSAYDVYTVAGSAAGTAGSAGNGGAATSAELDAPNDMAVDDDGNLLIADTDNCRIQEVAKATGTQWGTVSMTADDIYSAAGRTGNCTGGADDKAATASDLDYPEGVADPAGNLYVADTGSNVVKEVAGATGTQYGQSMTEGDVYAVAGTGTAGSSGNGGLAASAELDGPQSVAVDSSGDVYIADTGNDQIREASAGSPYDITDTAGDGYTLHNAGDGGPAVQAALDAPMGVTSDAHGDLYIADAGNNRIQEIAAYNHTQWGITMTAGDTYTIAGSPDGVLGTGGNGTAATSELLAQPTAVALDGSGNLYIADTGNSRVVEIAATSHTQYGIAMTVGDAYTVAGSITGASGDTSSVVTATSALLNLPEQIAVDPAGDLFIDDTLNSRITEVPDVTGSQFGISMTAGDMYTVAGSAVGTPGSTGDGGPGTSALLSDPFGLALDSAGDVYISDTGNNRVQELAATSHTQRGVAMKTGDIYTIAGSAEGTYGNSGDGGPATSAAADCQSSSPPSSCPELDNPVGVTVSASGDLYIADAQNNQVREVPAASGSQWGQAMTAGDIYTVAGSATAAIGTGCPTSGNPDGGCPVESSLLDFPFDLSTDQAGDLYIPDENSSTVTEAVATASPAFPVYPAGTDITITQTDGSQVTFSPPADGACTSPEVSAGGYCVLPTFQGATLTSDSSSSTYAFSPGPNQDTYTYSWDGQLVSETDTAGNVLTVTYDAPASACPSTASSCETITSASGRALDIGSDTSGLVTSVTDPMGREWTYAYNSSDQLVSATDPMGNTTSYTYGQGSNGPMQANDLLTITEPNAQPGGPDVGDSTVNAYNSTNQVTSQTDPMGYITTFDYCVNQADGDCLDTATGNGPVTVTDGDGNATVYDYDQGNLAAQSQWTGAVASGTLTDETDNGADTTANGTNAAGTLEPTWQADGDGNMTTYSYDANGDITAVTSPDGIGAQTATTTAWYDPTGGETCSATAEAATPCSSGETGPAPVAAGTPASPLVITPPASAPPAGETWNLYDSNGNRLYSATGVYEPGATSVAYIQTSYQLFDYDSVTLPGSSTAISCAAQAPSPSLPCATVNPDGVVTQLGYDAAGDLTSESTPDGNAGGELGTTTYSYDSDGEPVSTTAPDGNLPNTPAATQANYTTGTAYNNDGEVTSVTDGVPVNNTAPTVTPRVTSYGYDADGNQTSVTDARGYTITTTYDADDQATLSTDADGNQTLTCYDADGNVADTVPPAGVAANSLRPASCPTSYPSGYGDRLAADATTSTFDAADDPTVTTTPAPAGQSGSETTTYTYNGDGNPTEVTAPPSSTGGAGQVTVSAYNDANELVSQTQGYGTAAASTTTYCYDPDGDTTSVVMPDGNTSGTASCETSSPWEVSASSYPTQASYQTTSSYDSAGELVSSTSPATAAAPSGATTTATYDPAGNQLTSTDPDGVTTTTTYTPLGQVATTAYSGSSAPPVSYSYDADGSLTAMTDGTGSSSYSYNPFGELTSAQNGAGQTVGYSYDADGNVTGITYPLPASATWASTDTVTYGYDDADTLTSVADFNNHQISITNSADSLPTAETLGTTGDTITTTYDATDNPSAITLKNSSSTLQSFSYSDAPDGSITSEIDVPSSSSATYTYDGHDRVASMTIGGNSLNYTFDASGNLTTLPTGATATYDHDSELTSSVLGGTTTNYTYNADGDRLSAAQGSTTTASATWNGADQLTAFSNSTAEMSQASYDGNGLRASATFTPVGGSATMQNFAWNTTGSVPQLLMDSTNAYIYAGGTAPIEQVSLSSGAVSYLLADALGSVRGVVGSSGSLSATTSYDAWGNPQTGGGLTSYTPFGFAGAYTDPDGLLYLVNRYYDPATGQFISVDPDVSQTLAPYGYATGNPVMNTDPMGLRPAYEALVAGNVTTVSSAAQYHQDAYNAIHYPPPPPPPAPAPRPRPRRKPPVAKHRSGGIGKTLDIIGHVLADSPVGQAVREVRDDLRKALSNPANQIAIGVIAGGEDPVAGDTGDTLQPVPPENGSLDPFENARYTQKVQDQMALGDYHSFPELVKNTVTPENVSQEFGDDGELYTHVRIPGTFGETEGTFHWIIDDEGVINHRMFEEP